MPNGFHGSREDWQSLIAPLEVLDPMLKIFAASHSVKIERNERNWPDRTIRWDSPISRLIQIYLDGDNEGKWCLWICASEDREDGRFWKRRTLKKSVPIAELESGLDDLLSEAWDEVSSWSADDLVAC